MKTCPTCGTPNPTNHESHASDGLSALGNHVARLRASDGVSERVAAIKVALTASEAEIEQRGYELGFRAGRDVAAAAPVTSSIETHPFSGPPPLFGIAPPLFGPQPGPLTIELGPATLRTLVAALLRASHKWSSDETIAVVNADNLLAHLKETK